MKTTGLALLTSLAAGLALTGCKQDTAPTPTKTEASSPKEVTVSDLRLTLPAVKGNPGAAYFIVVNRTAQPVSLTGIEVAGAEHAEIHQGAGANMAEVERLTVPAGGFLAFAPTGYHAMVFGVPTGLKVGGEAQVTLTFEDGRRVSASAKVQAPGTVGMEHGAMH